MTVNCYQCGVLTSVLEHGELHVHFPDNAATKPCLASWRRARHATYPFDEWLAAEIEWTEESGGAS